MKSKFSRLLYSLAALGLTEYELKELLLELRKIHPEDICLRVKSITHNNDHLTFEENNSSYMRSSKTVLQSNDASVGPRVERLLKAEAHLSTGVAVTLLTSKLIELKFIDKNDVPPLSRKSLGDWVVRLSQKIPAKDILSCATILRNEYIHSPISDWTLSGSKK